MSGKQSNTLIFYHFLTLERATPTAIDNNRPYRSRTYTVVFL